MDITRHNAGPRMSQIVEHGDLIYLAGQVGRGPDMTSQTKDMLASVDRLWRQSGVPSHGYCRRRSGLRTWPCLVK